MSNISRIPDNRNFLSPLSFDFNIFKTPNMNYFVQSANIPGISLGIATVSTPFNIIKFSGDKITYSDLNVTMRVDEELRNYYEIFNWMMSISRNKSFVGYASVANAGLGEGVFSDATLTVLSSAKTPIARINYLNMFPTQLSDLIFDSKDTTVNYLDAIVTFAYERYEIEYLL